MQERAIAFDFDGTLVASGHDKNVHVMVAACAACAATGFRRFLHPDAPGADVERLLRGVEPYPGAPRFQQLSALLNSLLHDRPEAVEAPAGLGLDPALADQYESVREIFTTTYSALNDAAAARYWRAYPAALEAIPRLAARFDLYVASGLPQEILEADLVRHGFAPGQFRAVWGSDSRGGADKGEHLKRIAARGYRDVLFVGDATRDLEYAKEAGVKFFRVAGAGDFVRLEADTQGEFPDLAAPWGWTGAERAFLRDKSLRLIAPLLAGRPLTPAEAVAAIHDADPLPE
jgi:phosphoglycolate phosphatase-like HAD superfamily hydrolase